MEVVYLEDLLHNFFKELYIGDIDIMYFFPMLKKRISTRATIDLLNVCLNNIPNEVSPRFIMSNTKKIQVIEEDSLQISREENTANDLSCLVEQLYLIGLTTEKYTIYDLARVESSMDYETHADNDLIDKFYFHPEADPLLLSILQDRPIGKSYICDPRSNKIRAYRLVSDQDLRDTIREELLPKMFLCKQILPYDIYFYIMSSEML